MKTFQNALSSFLFPLSSRKEGFTLIELVISIALLAIVTIGTLVVLDPAGRLASARNSQRQAHLNTILNAIRQNLADNRGTFSCAAGDIPTSTKKMATGAGNFDIYSCIVPTYIFSLPFDPATSTAHFISATDYDTGYTVIKASSTGIITLVAPAAELKKSISITR